MSSEVAAYEHVLCEEDGLFEALAVGEAQHRRERPCRKTGIVVLAGVGVLALVGLFGRRSAMQRGDIHSTEEKVQLAAELAQAVASGMKIAHNVQEAIPEAQFAWGNLSKTKWNKPESMVALPPWMNMSMMANFSVRDMLRPSWINRHDGNPCADDEEDFEGLCYKKCANLTNGTFPFRSTAWSCCSATPCSFFNSEFVAPIPCHGFDVAGTAEGQGCPHLPGSCMVDEEFSLGVCYKKCAILTNNTYPYRSAAETCCRYNNHLACMDAANANTSADFGVGGGKGDHVNATPSAPHAPLLALTEALANTVVRGGLGASMNSTLGALQGSMPQPAALMGIAAAAAAGGGVGASMNSTLSALQASMPQPASALGGVLGASMNSTLGALQASMPQPAAALGGGLGASMNSTLSALQASMPQPTAASGGGVGASLNSTLSALQASVPQPAALMGTVAAAVGGGASTNSTLSALQASMPQPTAALGGGVGASVNSTLSALQASMPQPAALMGTAVAAVGGGASTNSTLSALQASVPQPAAVMGTAAAAVGGGASTNSTLSALQASVPQPAAVMGTAAAAVAGGASTNSTLSALQASMPQPAAVGASANSTLSALQASVPQPAAVGASVKSSVSALQASMR